MEELAQPDTATNVARRLGIPRQKVNYHLHQLEREGLVELVEERRKRNCLERVVRTTARSYVVRAAARILTDVAALKYLAEDTRALSAFAVVEAAVENRIQLADAASRARFFADLMDVLSRLIAKYQENDGVMSETIGWLARGCTATVREPSVTTATVRRT